METAFQPGFAITTDCELSGKTPNDQFLAWAQLPLAGFIQEFVCAQTEVDMNAITDTTKHIARPIPAVRHIEVRMVIQSLSNVGQILRHLGRWRCGVLCPT